MKSILNIIKATVWGGVFFLVPVALVVIIIGKVLVALQKILNPILKNFPDTNLVGILAFRQVVALLILLIICFVAGLLAQTKTAQRFIGWLDDSVLGFVPGYRFFKNLIGNLTGLEEQDMKIVLARVDDGWQLSFLVEQISDDMYTVFVPGSPNPWSGSVYHLETDKIIWTDIKKKQALSCLRQLGIGSATILKDQFNITGRHRPG
jgi:uncharacterized membrane protein